MPRVIFLHEVATRWHRDARSNFLHIVARKGVDTTRICVCVLWGRPLGDITRICDELVTTPLLGT